MKEVFEKIADLNNEYIKIWEDVLNIESPSSYKEGVDEVGKYFIRLAEKNGWQTEVFPQEKFGDVVAITMNPEAEGKSVSLLWSQVWSPMPGTRERRGWLPAGACKPVLGRTE